MLNIFQRIAFEKVLSMIDFVFGTPDFYIEALSSGMEFEGDKKHLLTGARYWYIAQKIAFLAIAKLGDLGVIPKDCISYDFLGADLLIPNVYDSYELMSIANEDTPLGIGLKGTGDSIRALYRSAGWSFSEYNFLLSNELVDSDYNFKVFWPEILPEIQSSASTRLLKKAVIELYDMEGVGNFMCFVFEKKCGFNCFSTYAFESALPCSYTAFDISQNKVFLFCPKERYNIGLPENVDISSFDVFHSLLCYYESTLPWLSLPMQTDELS